MTIRNSINFLIELLFMTSILFSILYLNYNLIIFNYDFGMLFCAVLDIPINLTLSVVSPGFIWSFCITMFSIETICLIPIYKSIKIIFYNI